LVDTQAAVWELLGTDETFDLIVTDMHYPLEKGAVADHNAGFILIEQMKEKGIHIPVIICSTRNFSSPDVFGTVWYNKLKDIGFEFKEILERYLWKIQKE
jgi:CheY-like chemotaxis protein